MRISVAYDGSSSADAAIEDLRKAGIPEQAETRVICVENSGLHASPPGDIEETDLNGSSRLRLVEAERLAEIASDRIRSYFPRWTVLSEALWGPPAKMILDTARWWHPDILVAGSHGRSGVGRLLLGSVSLELVHKAACSVRVARIGGVSGIAAPLRIVIGNDGSKEAEAGVRSVAGRSWPEKTQARIISVVQTLVPAVSALEASTYSQEPAFTVISEVDEQERTRLRTVTEESADSLRRAGLIVTPSVADGDAGEAIVSAAEFWNADAIFVGARGLGRMQRLLLGSVSTHVVTHARCTVEVVRRAA